MFGIRCKHHKPDHPPTPGQVERYHQTRKKYLRTQRQVATIEALQKQIDRFVLYYNEERPHGARGCAPMPAWRALDKATPQLEGQPILAKTRVRHDHVEHWGSVTLRYRRKLHHISIGRHHRHERVIILMADLDVRVVSDQGELLRHFTLDTTRDCQARSRSTL